MQISFHQEKQNILHNFQLSTKSGKHIFNKALSVSFYRLKDNILNHAKTLKDQCPISGMPNDVFLSFAKIEAAFNQYLKYMEYEITPNYDDLKDFTGGAIKDKDIANHLYFKHAFVYLDDICENQYGEAERVLETISDGRYEEVERDDLIYESLNLLSPLDREILTQRFGLLGHDEHSVPELCAHFHLNKNKMTQRLNSALKNMKTIMETMM